MTKRRDLKKAIDYLSGELMMEVLLCSLQPKTDRAKLEEIMARVCKMSTEFKCRTQHPTGNSDNKLVKQYFKKVRNDFDTEIDEIYTELLSLNKEKTKN